MLPFSTLGDKQPREGIVRLRLLDLMAPKVELSSSEEEKILRKMASRVNMTEE